MRKRLGVTQAAPPRTFSLGMSTANGIRSEVNLSGNPPWKSTGLAIAQSGEWLVKIRATSQTLDAGNLARRIDTVLNGMRLPKNELGSLPLTLPAQSGSGTRFAGKQIKTVDDSRKAGAAGAGMMIFAHSAGIAGLAAEPQNWCRAGSVAGSDAAFYRSLDGNMWVALPTDAGVAISAQMLPGPAGPGAATYVSEPGGTVLTAIYDALPDPATALVQSTAVMEGRDQALAAITTRKD